MEGLDLAGIHLNPRSLLGDTRVHHQRLVRLIGLRRRLLLWGRLTLLGVRVRGSRRLGLLLRENPSLAGLRALGIVPTHQE